MLKKLPLSLAVTGLLLMPTLAFAAESSFNATTAKHYVVTDSDYSTAQDTVTADSSGNGLTFGASLTGGNFEVERDKVRFNVVLPAGATITGCSLSVSFTNDSIINDSATVDVYDATWLGTNADYDSNTFNSILGAVNPGPIYDDPAYQDPNYFDIPLSSCAEGVVTYGLKFESASPSDVNSITFISPAKLKVTYTTVSIGIVLDNNFVAGAKNGIADAADTLQSTINNRYLVELLIMFIGFAVVAGLIMHALKGHRGTGSGGYVGSNNMRKAFERRGSYLSRHGGGTSEQQREYKEFGKNEGFL